MYPIDRYPTEGHIPSVAALPSRVRARPRAVQGCAVPAAAQKTRAGMGAGHAGAQVPDAGHVTGSSAAAGGGDGRLERRMRLGAEERPVSKRARPGYGPVNWVEVCV